MRVEGVVVDTNVLISAILSPLGKPFACLRWVLDNAALIVSRELLEELETRLARPKFNKYVDDLRRRAFVADLGPGQMDEQRRLLDPRMSAVASLVVTIYIDRPMAKKRTKIPSKRQT